MIINFFVKIVLLINLVIYTNGNGRERSNTSTAILKNERFYKRDSNKENIDTGDGQQMRPKNGGTNKKQVEGEEPNKGLDRKYENRQILLERNVINGSNRLRTSTSLDYDGSDESDGNSSPECIKGTVSDDANKIWVSILDGREERKRIRETKGSDDSDDSDVTNDSNESDEDD